MNLEPYVESIRVQLEATAEAGDEGTRDQAKRVVASLDAAIRLALQDALAAAADEITVELAPGSVEVRLRSGEPRFVVTPPSAISSYEGGEAEGPLGDWVAPRSSEEGQDTTARINLRLPERLKAGIERAAEREGLSVNAWLVRTAAVRVERSQGGSGGVRRAPKGAEHFKGWVQ
jgi:hypothetical protein